MKRVLLLIFAIACLPLFCKAQSGNQYGLKLKSGTVFPNPDALVFRPSKEEMQIQSFEGQMHLLVQFSQMPTESEKANLTAKIGMVFLDYVPDLAFIVSIPESANMNGMADYGIRHIRFISSDLKLAENLKFLSEVPAYAKATGAQIRIIFSLFGNVDEKNARKDFIKNGLSNVVQRPNTKTFEAEISFSQLTSFANWPAILSIEAGGRKEEINNYPGVATHRANILNNGLGRNLRGQGVCGGVGDGGFVRAHLDFGTRLINANPNTIASFGDHGDHVAGTVGGAGVINTDNAGMAPACSLVTEQTSAIVWGAPGFYSAYKMVVTNNSYGFAISCPTTGTYGNYSSTSRDIDAQMVSNTKIMHCFAASNDGSITPCGSYTGGFGTISDGYGNSKNALVIGAVSSDDGLAGFSSRGPCKDGRVKPEVVSVGTSVISTIPTNAYGSKQGTSMAAPGVTGSLLLLYQRFRQLNGNQDPDGALIKAITCNTADDVGNANVDYRHGFGRINMLNAVKALEENRYIINTISQGNT